MNEINEIPEPMLPRFYRVIRAVRTELTPKVQKSAGRTSLKGIWGNVEIDKRLFDEARQSMFSFEAKEDTP